MTTEERENAPNVEIHLSGEEIGYMQVKFLRQMMSPSVKPHTDKKQKKNKVSSLASTPL